MAWEISIDKYHGRLREVGFQGGDHLAYDLGGVLVLLSPASHRRLRQRPRDDVAWAEKEGHDTRHEVLPRQIEAGQSGYTRASCHLKRISVDLYIDNTQVPVSLSSQSEFCGPLVER